MFQFRAINLEDFKDACKNHFCSGRLCLGFPQDEDEEEASKPFLVSQTPIPRKYSRACTERIDDEDANACGECIKICEVEEEEEEVLPAVDLKVPTPEVVKVEEEPEADLPNQEVAIDCVGAPGKYQIDVSTSSQELVGVEEEHGAGLPVPHVNIDYVEPSRESLSPSIASKGLILKPVEATVVKGLKLKPVSPSEIANIVRKAKVKSDLALIDKDHERLESSLLDVSPEPIEKNNTEQKELESASNPGAIEVVHTSQPGVVGEGDLSVMIHAEKRTHSFGPVNLRTDEEAQLLWVLLKDKYNAKR